MRVESNIEQWKELYNIAMEIGKLKPWDYFWDVELITIMLPGREEPCFCSILGRERERYGINVFIGFKGLRDYLDIVESGEGGIPPEYVMFEQSNISCFWGSREDVPNKQKKIIKELGLKFRGKNQWLYFESYKKGYMPYILDEEEVLFLTELFHQLYMALGGYTNNEIKVNFGAGQTLLHEYDEEKKEWVDMSAPLPIVEKQYPLLILEDELLRAKMKKQAKINILLELDMVYMNAYVRDGKYDRPINPKLLLLVDHSNGVVVGQSMLTPEHDEANEIFNIFIDFVMRYGRMTRIIIRNPYIASVLKDTCDYCDISLGTANQLPAVDTFINELMEV
ncbi:MAG: hypothetical protein GX308_09330 [Epulopiscium sp.]|nr:hypothetical protein [Candidatus Epulonipiscium sp.]